MSQHEHELREAELLMCNICAQAFSTEEFLSAHLNDAHQDEPASGCLVMR